MTLSSPPNLPRQCAAVLLPDEAGRVLFVRQNYGGQFWGVPGGIVDPGETPLQAAIREAQEEVGVQVELTTLVGLYTLQGGGWPDVLASVFLGRLSAGVPTIQNPSEIAAFEWLSLQDAPSPLLPDVEAALEDYAAGRLGSVRAVQRKLSLPPLDE